MAVGPLTQDEKQLVLGRIVRDLNRQRGEAKRADCDMLAFLLAHAEDEARTQLEKLEGELFPEHE